MEQTKKQRREKGSGTVFQSSDGKWIARYKDERFTKPKAFYGKSEAEVKKKLKEYKNEVSRKNPIVIKKQSVKTYMNSWLTKVKINEVKPRTYDDIENTLENQVYPYLGDLQTTNINANDVQDMINSLTAKGLSYSRTKKAYDAVNACFKRGVIKGEVEKNPCLGVSLPRNRKKKQSDIIYFSKQKDIDSICEVSALKYKSGRPVFRIGYIFIILLYTGMRISELLGLKWTDIDIKNKTLTIRRTVVLTKNRDEDKEGKYLLLIQDSAKTESSERIIPINKKAVKAIEELRKITGRFEFIVSTSTGNIVDPSSIDRMFKDVLKRCGITPLCGVHALRHTFASLLFKKGVEVKYVSELLGHSNVTVTYNTYIHLIKEQKHKMVSLLDNL